MLVNYLSVIIECLERFDVFDDIESYILGWVFRGGKLVWFVCGVFLEVINIVIGLWYVLYRFGWSLY